jgi:hypothetical protein
MILESHPLPVDGLIASIVGNRCLISVFGNSPMSAMILRPIGDIYEPVIFSRAGKTVNEDIFTGDLLVVGESARICEYIKGRNFAVEHDLEAIARSIYRPEVPKSSLVIVCKIELSSSNK